jgi:hypothetical protein
MALMLNPKGKEAPSISTSQVRDVLIRVFPQLDPKKARQLANNLVNSAKSYYNS